MGGRGGGSPSQRGRDTAPATVSQAPAAPSAQRGVGLGDVMRAYEAVARPGDWASLADVRDRMGGTRAEQDALLRILSRSQQVLLVPDSNQKTLTPRQREASMSLGNQDQHLIMVTPQAS